MAPPGGEADAPSPLVPRPLQRNRGRSWPRTGWLIVVAAAAAVVVVVVAVLAVSGESAPSFGGVGFTTSYPSGWTLAVSHPGPGATLWSLSSDGSKLNDLGIPPDGSVGVTVGQFPADALTTDPAASTQSPVALLPNVIGVPRAAVSVAVTSALQPTALGGVPAAAIGYSYTYNGLANVQSDVAARKGNEIVWVEVDTGPAQSARGAAALRTIVGQWNWR